MELAEYGAGLAEQFQYPGDPPFDDFYLAHVQLFKVLADQNRDEGLAYFQNKLDSVPEEDDKPMIAYVLEHVVFPLQRYSDAVFEFVGHVLEATDEIIAQRSGSELS